MSMDEKYKKAQIDYAVAIVVSDQVYVLTNNVVIM